MTDDAVEVSLAGEWAGIQPIAAAEYSSLLLAGGGSGSIKGGTPVHSFKASSKLADPNDPNEVEGGCTRAGWTTRASTAVVADIAGQRLPPR